MVGDVVGHDVAAAAAMGHLRGLLRACVWDAADADPAAVLARVDRLVQGLRVASLATMVYAPRRPPGRRRRRRGGCTSPTPGTRRCCCATGRARPARSTASPACWWASTPPATARPLALDVPPGSTLVAYTDGLIERPGRDMDEGIHELCERLAARARRTPGPRELCDAAVSGALDHRDDVALIAVRFG